MQTLSGMQRSSYDKKNILTAFIFFLSILYESLTTLYPFLPPLLGIAFFIFASSENRLIKIYIFLYTLFFEADHGLPLFSTFLSFTILKYIFLKLQNILSSKLLIKISLVATFYLFYPIFLYFLNKVFLTQMITFDLEYFKYLLIEIILVAMI